MELNIKIPSVSESFYSDSQVNLNKRALNTIMDKYGDYIRNSAVASNVPAEIIQSFIFIESAGKVDAINGRAIGLMQVSTGSATEIISMEKFRGDLFDAEKTILRKYLGDRLDLILALKKGEPTLIVTKEDLYKPELNICIGTIYLSLLMNETVKQKGKLMLEYVVAGYNMGYYAAKKLYKKSVDEMLSTMNTTTRDYILKLVGKNGMLDTLI